MGWLGRDKSRYQWAFDQTVRVAQPYFLLTHQNGPALPHTKVSEPRPYHIIVAMNAGKVIGATGKYLISEGLVRHDHAIFRRLNNLCMRLSWYLT